MTPAIRNYIVLFAASASSALAQYSAWQPQAGRGVITPVFVRQSFNRFWAGQTIMTLPDTVRQSSLLVTAEAGLTRRVALDVTSGYTQVRSAAFGGPDRDGGVADAQLGLRYQLTPGGAWRPALAVRAGAVVRGTYTADRPYSAGDGGSGAEFSILAGQTLGETGAGIYADIGQRVRNGPVPPELFGSAGIYKSLGPTALSFTYRKAHGLSGTNLMDPGFTFPSLRERQDIVEGGIGFGRGSRSYQLFVAQSVGGRNTGRKLVTGIAVSFGFGLPWRN